MASQYYRDDAILGASGDFQTSASLYHGFNQPHNNFNKPPGFSYTNQTQRYQLSRHWNLPVSNEHNRSFPHKGSAKPPGPKRSIVEGKPPSQLMNELFKGSTYTYTPEGSMFKCVANVNLKEFTGISTSKKGAKNEASMAALRALRPEVAAVVDNASGGAYTVPVANVPVKKIKISPLDSASNLKELLNQMSLAEGKQFKMDTSDATYESNATQKRYTATLIFKTEGKMCVDTGDSINAANAAVVRQALREIFKVSDDDMMKVIRRGTLKKFANMSSVSALSMMCTVSHYILVSTVFEECPEGKVMFYNCVITITNWNGENFVIRGAKCKSKSQAKEGAAMKALNDVFQVHPASMVGMDKDAHDINPVTKLYETGTRQKPALRPEFTDLGEEMNGTIKLFKCKCAIGNREFLGSGKSKKDAKNEAANLALNNVFHMDVQSKKEDPSSAVSRGVFEGAAEGAGNGIDDVYEMTCDYVSNQYAQMCNFYNIPPSSDFACFVLLNDKDMKKIISVGSSPSAVTPMASLSQSNGKSIVHHDSVVYARRGAVRHFIAEIVKGDRGEESMFEMAEDGMYRMKPNLRLFIVSSQPVDIKLSAPESTVRRLGVFKQSNIVEAVDETESPRIHCTADKMFKWCYLGVQGALLVNRVHPIVPSALLTVARCPLSDVSYLHSFTGRCGPAHLPITVRSAKRNIDPAPSRAHIWSRAESRLEEISHYTGLNAAGEESLYSKQEVYRAFLEATPNFPRALSYDKAKAMASQYTTSKAFLYQKMAEHGLGKWNGLRGLADNFVIG